MRPVENRKLRLELELRRAAIMLLVTSDKLGDVSLQFGRTSVLKPGWDHWYSYGLCKGKQLRPENVGDHLTQTCAESVNHINKLLTKGGRSAEVIHEENCFHRPNKDLT